MSEHTHQWRSLDSNHLECNGCKTVSTIDLAIESAYKAGGQSVNAKHLMNRSFKKSVHDEVYAALMSDKTYSRTNDQARLDGV